VARYPTRVGLAALFSFDLNRHVQQVPMYTVHISLTRIAATILLVGFLPGVGATSCHVDSNGNEHCHGSSKAVLIGLGAACSKYTVFFFLDHYAPNIDRNSSPVTIAVVIAISVVRNCITWRNERARSARAARRALIQRRIRRAGAFGFPAPPAPQYPPQAYHNTVPPYHPTKGLASVQFPLPASTLPPHLTSHLQRTSRP